ncbi:hypothetical protein FOFC_15889 [Fusarium oxysporum]|nr:hypothetical protein FOFC_15889 [Fusarium oxysporum]
MGLRERTPTRRPSWLEGDQTVTGSFLLDSGITRRTAIREGLGSRPLAGSKLETDHRHYLTLSIKTAWQKLNQYYTKLGDSPLFAVSIIFHATLGMNYLEVNWASKE